MANAREIQNRIKSVNDTMKITNAMYMISSSKLQRAKKNYLNTLPYFEALQDSISRILRHVPNMDHKYFDHGQKEKPESEKKKGYIMVTADKGLAGAYNHNVIKKVEELMESEGQHFLFIVGEVGRNYFKNKLNENRHMVAHFHYTAQKPSMHRGRVIAEMILDWYNREALDEVCVVFTQMVNSFTTETTYKELLPLKREDFSKKLGSEMLTGVMQEEILMYPSVEKVIESVVPNYIAGFIYGVLVESFCSEQNARMMTMDAANRNGEELLKSLSITYNRLRQAAITQEISEVVGGAKSLRLKKKKLQESGGEKTT